MGCSSTRVLFIVKMCDRSLIEILLSETNFISVIGVFGYNPGLIREIDFRTELEGEGGFHEVIPINDRSVVERIHMNFRIQVIKDNVLSRSLPDGCVILLEHMLNENNFRILTYISENESYWRAMYVLKCDASRWEVVLKKFCACVVSNGLIASNEKRKEGLGLLRAVMNLIRVTKPLEKPQRRDQSGNSPVFGSLIGSLFGDGEIFAAFAAILGSPDSNSEETSLTLDILNVLVFYYGPDGLRAYLASEGKCIRAPTSDTERIAWTPGSSLFTALLVVFERDEPMRIQLFSILREIFRVSLAQDDKFLSVLYPNYMHWLLQPLKNNTFVHDGSAMFNLQDSIMELLTFCTENHGYRVKYLLGRQPVASYAEKMLRSKNKLFVIHAVKFVRACVLRAEAFFSRFLIQNNLFAAMLENLEVGTSNTGAVSSAILEVLSIIEKTNPTSLIEHLYTNFYQTYKAECPIVFEAIRACYSKSSRSEDADFASTEMNKIQFVRATSVDDEEELYWEKYNETTESTLERKGGGLLEEEVSCENRPRTVKLVDYDDDDDEPSSSQMKIDLAEAARPSVTSPCGWDYPEERELQLPVRKKIEEEVDTESFLGGSKVLAHKKARDKLSSKTRSPQLKTVFQKISWNLTVPTSSNGSSKHESTLSASTSACTGGKDSGTDAKCNDSNSASVRSGCMTCTDGTSAETAALVAAKRKLPLDEAATSVSLLKKSKTCTPISSS
ncbi:hypothetical protein PsorP6_014218 [Peronosclerospora sorghi]|uniref:Uncharacterized protein n=1 Tax=Peronosclerospora sorghi TaxID=230839 RepID=A0ACC0VGX1_9STRA|nr:hypothetical protein PsorP6_014218 [Peronosclerospora sorghi]